MNVPIVCLNETQLSSATALTDVSSTDEVVRNDDQFGKFKSLAVLYNKHNFKCLENEDIDGIIHIAFLTTLFNLSNFGMLLVVYRQNNSNIAQYVGHITYLAITKHVDLIQGDFNEDSIGEGSIKI